MATKKNTKPKSRKLMYSVLRGAFYLAPEQTHVIGLFTSLSEARKRVLSEYCQGMIDGELAEVRRSFWALENGHEFWTIESHRV